MIMLPRNVKSQSGNHHIQVGIETGQRKWNLHVTSPIAGLLRKQRFTFTGDLDEIQSSVRAVLRDFARIGNEHQLPVYGVYEAGAFGQKLGRDLIDDGINPVQLVSRQIEYVRFGGERRVPKSDRIDAWRQASIPLDHPNLPHADVQTPQEEELRELISEEQRLDKAIGRSNARMCAILRRVHLHARHYKIPKWESYLLEHQDKLSANQRRQLATLLDEVRNFTRSRDENQRLIPRQLLAAARSGGPTGPTRPPLPASSGRTEPLAQ